MLTTYRANFGDGTWTKSFLDVRDARLAKWGRAAIVQHRTRIEVSSDMGRTWESFEQSNADRCGPPIVEKQT